MPCRRNSPRGEMTETSSKAPATSAPCRMFRDRQGRPPGLKIAARGIRAEREDARASPCMEGDCQDLFAHRGSRANCHDDNHSDCTTPCAGRIRISVSRREARRETLGRQKKKASPAKTGLSMFLPEDLEGHLIFPAGDTLIGGRIFFQLLDSLFRAVFSTPPVPVRTAFQSCLVHLPIREYELVRLVFVAHARSRTTSATGSDFAGIDFRIISCARRAHW